MRFLYKICIYFEYIFYYAFRELFPVNLAGNTLSQKLVNFFISLRRCIPGFLNILVIMMMVVTILAMWGIMNGADIALKKSLEKGSRMLSIDAFCGGAGSKKAIIVQSDIVNILNLKSSDGRRLIKSVSGWNDISIHFYLKNKKGGYKLDDNYRDGRTVKIKDSILQQLSYQKKISDNVENKPGIIVARSLLTALGYGKNELPSELYIEYDMRKAPIPVLGIVENLWNGEFLMPEIFSKKYLNLQWDPEPLYKDFCWGPICSKDIKSVIDKLAASYSSDAYHISCCERNGKTFWIQFKVVGRGLTEKYICGSFAKRLRKKIQKQYPAQASSASILLGENVKLKGKNFLDKLDGYGAITVLVETIDDVLPAVASIKQMGLNCDNRLKEDIIWANQLRKFSSGLFWVVVGTVAILALINIYLSFTQKIHTAIPEMGILKAFGHGSMTVILIQIVETIIIWGIAMPFGSFVALYAGKQVELFIVKTFHLDTNLKMFILSPHIIFFAGVGTLLAACLATSFATFLAALKNPSDALSYKK